MIDRYSPFGGLDLLASAVVLLDAELRIRYVNPAAENLLAASSRNLINRPLQKAFTYSRTLKQALDNAVSNNWSYTGQNIEIRRGDNEKLSLNCTVTPLRAASAPEVRLLIELQPIDQQLKASREEQLLQQ
ncbi:MAG: nitrogen regulation protein, partial [Pseudomonadota bacterium]